MSHSRQRKDKICLNCNAELHGPFCHICGQENIEPKESFLGLLAHFFYDITHFDGKFFSTVKYLLLRPGFLSREYVKGRRASYLHPIRMYVFTSAIFFLIFFSIFNLEDVNLGKDFGARRDSISRFKNARGLALEDAKTKSDSVAIDQAFSKLNKIPATILPDSHAAKFHTKIPVQQLDFKSQAEYDSVQQSLPADKRDGWYKRYKTHKLITFNERLNEDPETLFKVWGTRLIHKFPQLLFVSLPFFALILQLLYIRRRQFYYSDHAIFTIHLYIFTFIALFFILMFRELVAKFHFQWMVYLMIGTGIYMVYYTYRAMYKFYQQGAIKTFFKFWLLSILSFMVIFFLSIVFFILSIFEI